MPGIPPPGRGLRLRKREGDQPQPDHPPEKATALKVTRQKFSAPLEYQNVKCSAI